ncbi:MULTISPECIES: terminase small subunit [unclassified Pseudomonas]|uniref:terminase small subunit n=1 Tax=unclassified Pseudomonas TaxID=196821 RepID=UPI0025F4F427|nr:MULTISPECIES: terminase small subunit [unclassified Pseudomonas]
MALTPKKQAFVSAKRAGASNKDAAIAAGYAASSAAQAGARLAKDKFVIAALAAPTVNKKVNKFVKGDAPPKSKGIAVPPTEDAEEVHGDAGFDLGKAMRFSDPKEFLLATMNDFETDSKLRVDAAKALMPFIHPRKGEGGKKEEKENAAKKAAKGRFGAAPPPLSHLRAVK